MPTTPTVDPKPFYAIAGVSDLAVERIRTRATALPHQVKEIPAFAAARRAQRAEFRKQALNQAAMLRKQAESLPADVRKQAEELRVSLRKQASTFPAELRKQVEEFPAEWRKQARLLIGLEMRPCDRDGRNDGPRQRAEPQ